MSVSQFHPQVKNRLSVVEKGTHTYAYTHFSHTHMHVHTQKFTCMHVGTHAVRIHAQTHADTH